MKALTAELRPSALAAAPVVKEIVFGWLVRLSEAIEIENEADTA